MSWRWWERTKKRSVRNSLTFKRQLALISILYLFGAKCYVKIYYTARWHLDSVIHLFVVHYYRALRMQWQLILSQVWLRGAERWEEKRTSCALLCTEAVHLLKVGLQLESLASSNSTEPWLFIYRLITTRDEKLTQCTLYTVTAERLE